MKKILISIVTERSYNFLDTNNILPSEQKGCKKRILWLQRPDIDQQDVAGKQLFMPYEPKYRID